MYWRFLACPPRLAYLGPPNPPLSWMLFPLLFLFVLGARISSNGTSTQVIDPQIFALVWFPVFMNLPRYSSSPTLFSLRKPPLLQKDHTKDACLHLMLYLCPCIGIIPPEYLDDPIHLFVSGSLAGEECMQKVSKSFEHQHELFRRRRFLSCHLCPLSWPLQFTPPVRAIGPHSAVSSQQYIPLSDQSAQKVIFPLLLFFKEFPKPFR